MVNGVMEKLYTNYKGKKILLVDDNEMNIKVASKFLEPYQVFIETCHSGEECIDKITDGNCYDLIYMDDMMPNMTGTTTMQKLKKEKKYKNPICVLTANAIEGMREEYLNNGFDDYLSKPLRKDELDRVMHRFLDIKKDFYKPL